ncbi:MAG TPA: ABC transporter permease [Kofleriaceae bacterium]|jgi:ABC-2 type transport system permease protein
MRETFVIAKREFLERVRTRWFVIMTILGPFFMIGLFVIPVLLASSGANGAKVAIVDETGALGDKLAASFAANDQHWVAHVVPPTTTSDELRAQLRKKELSGYLTIPKDAFEGGEIVYRGDNATNQTVQFELHKDITAAMLAVRGQRFHLNDTQLVQLLTPPRISALHTNGETEGENGQATFLLGYMIAFILYMVLAIYGVNVMRSVVTEKTSRVIELMVATTKPSSLMAGKIIGVGGAGLAQIAIWFGVGGIALANRDALLGLFGASSSGASLLPSLGGLEIGVVIAFFTGGFLFYSTMYAAVGATVGSEQDSQQAQLPITMLLVVGIVSLTAITGDPRGHSAQLMTLIPFWSPMLMPLRYLLGGASLGEVGLSFGILLVSTALLARAAAKIYRVGILMYGKRPSLGELVRWLRY